MLNGQSFNFMKALQEAENVEIKKKITVDSYREELIESCDLSEESLGNNTFTDADEAEYYRNKELYATSHLARHKEAMDKAKEACDKKGIKVNTENGVYESDSLLKEAVFEIDYAPDGQDLSDENSVYDSVNKWLDPIADAVDVTVVELNGPSGWPVVRLSGNEEELADFLYSNYNSGEDSIEDIKNLYMLKEAEETEEVDKIKNLKLINQAAHSFNDEDLIDIWLTNGVPDGATEEDFEEIVNDTDSTYGTDYSSMVKLFTNLVKKAVEDEDSQHTFFECPEEAFNFVKNSINNNVTNVTRKELIGEGEESDKTSKEERLASLKTQLEVDGDQLADDEKEAIQSEINQIEMELNESHKADRQMIIDMIQDGGLDDIETLKKEGGFDAAVDYWVEHYYDDHSEKEIEQLKKDGIINEALLNFKAAGISRNPEMDFSDDGNRFRGYICNGMPISYLKSDGYVYLSIRPDYLEGLSYDEYSKLPSYRDCQKYNGVGEGKVDLNDVAEICKRFKAEYDEALKNKGTNDLKESEEEDEVEIDDMISELRDYYENYATQSEFFKDLANVCEYDELMNWFEQTFNEGEMDIDEEDVENMNDADKLEALYSYYMDYSNENSFYNDLMNCMNDIDALKDWYKSLDESSSLGGTNNSEVPVEESEKLTEVVDIFAVDYELPEDLSGNECEASYVHSMNSEEEAKEYIEKLKVSNPEYTAYILRNSVDGEDVKDVITLTPEDRIIKATLEEAAETDVSNLTEMKSQGNVYMLKDDSKFIVGENYNESEGIIENAEIYDEKEEADKDYLERCEITRDGKEVEV